MRGAAARSSASLVRVSGPARPRRRSSRSSAVGARALPLLELGPDPDDAHPRGEGDPVHQDTGGVRRVGGRCGSPPRRSRGNARPGPRRALDREHAVVLGRARGHHAGPGGADGERLVQEVTDLIPHAPPGPPGASGRPGPRSSRPGRPPAPPVASSARPGTWPRTSIGCPRPAGSSGPTPATGPAGPVVARRRRRRRGGGLVRASEQPEGEHRPAARPSPRVLSRGEARVPRVRDLRAPAVPVHLLERLLARRRAPPADRAPGTSCTGRPAASSPPMAPSA